MTQFPSQMLGADDSRVVTFLGLLQLPFDHQFQFIFSAFGLGKFSKLTGQFTYFSPERVYCCFTQIRQGLSQFAKADLGLDYCHLPAAIVLQTGRAEDDFPPSRPIFLTQRHLMLDQAVRLDLDGKVASVLLNRRLDIKRK